MVEIEGVTSDGSTKGVAVVAISIVIHLYFYCIAGMYVLGVS